MFRCTIPVLLFLASSLIGGPTSGQNFPSQGTAYPDFALPNIQDGSLTRLSDFRGKKILLIHFASW